MAGPRATRVGPLDFARLRQRLDAAQNDVALDAERARALLERRARALARKPDSRPTHEPLELLCFSLAGERYAIASRHVLQVAPLLDLTRVPGAEPHLLGVTNSRGAILPVFDLRVLLGVSCAGLSDMSRLLVLGADDAELGILADSADGVIRLAPDELLEPAMPLEGLARGCVRGVTRDALVVLDGAGLLSDRRLFLDEVSGERPEA